MCVSEFKTFEALFGRDRKYFTEVQIYPEVMIKNGEARVKSFQTYIWNFSCGTV